jgi:hypothetical protein
VGYFPIEVGDWYIFPVSFRSTNKNGEGNYFEGIPTDSKSADGLDRDWGNIQEASLANVLSYITSGAFVPLSTSRTQAASTQLSEKNRIFSDRSFKGTISRPKAIRP